MISIYDGRLFDHYLRAEKALITCEARGGGVFDVTSENSPGVLIYPCRVVETATRGECVTCTCPAGCAGEPCKHAALTAAKHSEAVRLLFALRRMEAQAGERRGFLDGTLTRRKVRGLVRAHETFLVRRHPAVRRIFELMMGAGLRDAAARLQSEHVSSLVADREAAARASAGVRRADR